MTAGAWTFTNGLRTAILDATFDVDSDTFKCALATNSSNLTATSTTYALMSGEVSPTGTGYSTGGAAITLAKSGTTSVAVTISGSAPVWTAGASNLTAKFAVIYEVGGYILCFCTLDSGGADVTATSGNTLTVGSSGGTVFTLA